MHWNKATLVSLVGSWCCTSNGPQQPHVGLDGIRHPQPSRKRTAFSYNLFGISTPESIPGWSLKSPLYYVTDSHHSGSTKAKQRRSSWRRNRNPKITSAVLSASSSVPSGHERGVQPGQAFPGSHTTAGSLVDPKPTSPWERVRDGSASSHRADPACKQLSSQRLLKLKGKQTLLVESWFRKASCAAGLHSSNTCSKTASTLLQHNVLPEAFQHCSTKHSPTAIIQKGRRTFQTPWNDCTAQEHRDQGHAALHPEDACSRKEEMLRSCRVPTCVLHVCTLQAVGVISPSWGKHRGQANTQHGGQNNTGVTTARRGPRSEGLPHPAAARASLHQTPETIFPPLTFPNLF